MTTAATGTHYMSNAYIMGWMETHTEGLYGKMRDAMDTSESRAHAEDALNQVKAQIAEAQAHDSDAKPVMDLIAQTIKDYGDEFPDAKKSLQSILDNLNDTYAQHVDQARQAAQFNDPNEPIYPGAPAILKPPLDVPPVKISKDDSDRWGKGIQDAVDGMSKEDQLGMVNIQEFNAQLNQAKQMASALMDSADKTASSIINHIA